jgi:hypothetical protein
MLLSINLPNCRSGSRYSFRSSVDYSQGFPAAGNAFFILMDILDYSQGFPAAGNAFKSFILMDILDYSQGFPAASRWTCWL